MQKKSRNQKTYEEITQRFIDALEEGRIPWRKTWKGGIVPQNYKSGHHYRGMNSLIAGLMPYDLPLFLTFKQAKELGGSVRKGEKSLPIVYWNTLYKNGEKGLSKTPIEGAERVFILKTFRVFNIEQIDGIEWELPEEVKPENENDPIPVAEGMVEAYQKKTGMEIKYGKSQAFYAPGEDFIGMPSINQFDTAEDYYQTMFHEMTHSTGHRSRLDRLKPGTKFGSKVYSEEELVAEIGANFMMNEAGLYGENDRLENSKAYVQGWISKLKDDPKFIFRASSEARKAVEFMTA